MSHKVTVVGTTGDTEVSFATEGELTAGAGESVLVAALRGGSRLIASGCHGGGCGICRIRVISGEYRTGPMSRAHVSEEDEAGRIALACRTFAMDDLVVTAQRVSSRVAT